MTPADDLLPRLVSRPWHRLAYGAKGVDGAADLDPSAPDERWHAVRINGKQARYAVDAVAPVIGGPAEKLAEGPGPGAGPCSASTRTRPSPRHLGRRRAHVPPTT